ncbi:MAG: Bax inhibitor-1/YccA family protein [Polymorphobacter sp.]|uniref:Bax inhibitor-1/YccA family protein n=1 Tax=Polymorphobacter sp. TaxID=1909290 RepID=UPI003A8B7D87
MANPLDPRIGTVRSGASADAGFDAGLRAHMLSVYNYMASGVLLTGIVAMLFARGGDSSLAAQIFMAPGILKYVVMFAPLGLVLWLSFGINKLSEGAAKGIFWAYAALMGVSLSTIFLVYTGGSIAQTFFATSAGFAALSLYGYTTKKDLSGMGKFLLMGLVGLIVASIGNIFFQSSALNLGISIIGVFIFAGLTVYDTQKIKNFYFEVAGTDFAGKAVVMGALTLYLDFINLFLYLLRFMGDRR